MTRCALVAIGLLTACGGGRFTLVPADASADGADGAGRADARIDGAGEASAVPGDGGGSVADGAAAEVGAPCANQPIPASTLACTGLYADFATKTVAPGVRFYQPAIPLWSDGAEKTRWIWLPPGTQIDASNPNEWSFPVGTKVWKEFVRNGKRIETRVFEKVDNGPPSIWHHATYAWNADDSAAELSGGGDLQLASDGGTYHIPIPAECDKCHNGRTDHILGFEQISLGLQGAQGLTLPELIAPVPAQLQLTIGDDGTGAAAPALGWLHINCGVPCHNANSTALAFAVKMHLRLDPMLLDGRTLTTANCDSLKTTIEVPATASNWVPSHWVRIVPGDPSHSLLVQLISNRGTNNPVRGQMPPIASLLVDTADVAQVVDWVNRIPIAPMVDGGSDAAPDAAKDGAAGPSGDAATDAGGNSG
jgi:hypothetical protein